MTMAAANPYEILVIKIAEAIKLFVERCLDTVVNLGSFEDLAVFGLVADSEYAHHAVTFHNLCAAHSVVCSGKWLQSQTQRVGGLMTDRLTCQG